MHKLVVSYSHVNTNLLVELTGDLILIDALNFKREIPSKASGYDSVYVDLTAVGKIDLTGLNALIMSNVNLRRSGVGLRIKAKKNHELFDLLHLTKFTNQFTIEVAD